MLNSISWDQFLTTIALVVGSYYFISFLLLYSKEVVNIIKQRVRRNPTTAVLSNQTDTTGSDDLMGKAQHQVSHNENVSRGDTIAANEIVFAPTHEIEDAIEIITPKDEEQNVFDTLVGEIETLIGIVADSSKEESAPLFQSLISRHSQLAQHWQDEVSAFIYKSCNEHCSFQFEPDEIRLWWSAPEN